jgi:hypothetical protein
MQLAALESRIDELVQELAHYRGFRTVWLGEQGELIHAEPEDMLEIRGFAYVATLFRPNREDLTSAALRVVNVELDEPVRRAMASWQAPGASVLGGSLDSSLVPAM